MNNPYRGWCLTILSKGSRYYSSRGLTDETLIHKRNPELRMLQKD